MELFVFQTLYIVWYFHINKKKACREEKPTRCHWMVYCTYNMLNMFRALLCPSSGARDYMCVITAYGVQCLVAGCWRSGAGQQAMHLIFVVPCIMLYIGEISPTRIKNAIVASCWTYFTNIIASYAFGMLLDAGTGDPWSITNTSEKSFILSNWCTISLL